MPAWEAGMPPVKTKLALCCSINSACFQVQSSTQCCMHTVAHWEAIAVLKGFPCIEGFCICGFEFTGQLLSAHLGIGL